MFTLNEITKHNVSSESSGTSESSDSSVEQNDTKKMTIHLRISDTTFVPKRSLRNGVEAIPKYAKREHHIDQYIGEESKHFGGWCWLQENVWLRCITSTREASQPRGHGWYPWRVYT